MKFSIIVPVYNAEDFVSDTIENLLKQDVDKEIILINDGSKDNSLSIIRDYEAKYDCIKTIDKPNGGVSTARNVGIDSSKGDYIIFVDSDDFIEDGLLQRCEDIFCKYDIETIYFTYKYVYPKSTKTDIPFYYKETGFYKSKDWLDKYQDLCDAHIINCIGTNIYKKSILDKYSIRFKEDLTYYEDICFATEYLGYTKNLYFINEPLYHYRIINPNSLVALYNPESSYCKEYMHKEQMKMFERVFGKDLIPYDKIYSVWSNDIVGCIDSLYKAENIKETEFNKILSFIKKLDYINKSLSVTNNKRNRRILKIIIDNPLDKIKIQLESMYRREKIKNDFVITPLRKIKKIIRNK